MCPQFRVSDSSTGPWAVWAPSVEETLPIMEAKISQLKYCGIYVLLILVLKAE